MLVFCISFVSFGQLLDRDLSKRLGCKPHGDGFIELQRQPWFQLIEWETLGSKEQTPPFVPDVRLF
jgi:serine/threonine kinase 32